MKTGSTIAACALLCAAGLGISDAAARRHGHGPMRHAPVRTGVDTRPVAAPAPAGTSIEGRIRLVAGPRQMVDADETAETVIYFLPAATPPRPQPREFTAVTYAKGFAPNLLVVPVGSTVHFANRDVILHNVFSATPGSTFSLGSYGPGETRSQVFDKPGLVVVNCSVHRNMRANVLVLATPYSTHARADGSFRLNGVPDGAGTLVLWHPRAAAQSIPWDGRSPLVVERSLVATRPRVGMTMN